MYCAIWPGFDYTIEEFEREHVSCMFCLQSRWYKQAQSVSTPTFNWKYQCTEVVNRCTIPAPVLGQRPAGIAKSSIVSFVKLPTVWDLSPVTSQLNPSLHPHCSRSNSLARHHFTNPIQLNVYVCCVCGCGCVRSWFCRLDIVQLSRLLLEAHCLKVCV